MDRDKVFELFDRINVWKRGGERAPHKPLLILYAMGKCQRNEGRLIPYSEVDEKLHSLLIEFGPLRKSVHPEYPFWRLQNDGIWEVLDADKLKRRKNSSDVLKSDLIKNNIFGGFIEPIYKSLRKDGRLLSEIAQIILTRNFPESIHGKHLTLTHSRRLVWVCSYTTPVRARLLQHRPQAENSPDSRQQRNNASRSIRYDPTSKITKCHRNRRFP